MSYEQKQKIIGTVGNLIFFISAGFLLYFLKTKQYESSAIAGSVFAFSHSFFFPWFFNPWLHRWLIRFARNPNHNSYTDRVTQRRFQFFTSSKKRRNLGMLIGGFIILIILLPTFFYGLEIDKSPYKKGIVLGATIYFTASFLGWSLGLLRDFYAFKKLPKGTIYSG